MDLEPLEERSWKASASPGTHQHEREDEVERTSNTYGTWSNAVDLTCVHFIGLQCYDRLQ